jgi:hypothetical protein
METHGSETFSAKGVWQASGHRPHPQPHPTGIHFESCTVLQDENWQRRIIAGNLSSFVNRKCTLLFIITALSLWLLATGSSLPLHPETSQTLNVNRRVPIHLPLATRRLPTHYQSPITHNHFFNIQTPAAALPQSRECRSPKEAQKTWLHRKAAATWSSARWWFCRCCIRGRVRRRLAACTIRCRG